MRAAAIVLGLFLMGCASDPPNVPDAGGIMPEAGGSDEAATVDGTTGTDGAGRNGEDAPARPCGTYAYQWHFAAPQNVRGANGTAASVTGYTHFVSFYESTPDLGKGALPQGGLIDSVLVKIDSMGKILWNVPFVGPGNDLLRGVAVDLTGDVYVVGESSGAVSVGGLNMNTTQLGSGMVDGFITKIRADGTYQWTRVITGTGETEGRAIAAHNQASHKTIVVGCNFKGTSVSFAGRTIDGDPGNTGTDAVIGAIDASGSVNWAVHAGGGGDGNDSVQGLAIDYLGNV